MNIEHLKKMLQQGPDNFLLRFGLGQSLLNNGNSSEAITHLQKALEFDPKHSSSWKLLGKALAQEERHDEAMEIFAKGIAVAESSGDLQAAKEMKVFFKRAQKSVQ